MGKTVKQIADEIGVSKTAVRKYMDDDFVGKYTTQEGERFMSARYQMTAERMSDQTICMMK